MSTPTNFTLYLSTVGDSVKIENFNQDGATLPEQQEALACRTHQEVLAFLEKLKTSETKGRLNFYHLNNYFYEKHAGLAKGTAHPCTLEDQIEFVRFKISEISQGARHATPTASRSWCNIV